MESQIIKKAISGDSDALTILIEKYKDVAYNLALSIVKNKDNAKDIIQDSFLKVLENIQKFRSDSNFSTWLYRIVYNQSIAFIKNANCFEPIDHEQASLFEDPENNDIKEEKFGELHKAIDLLEDTERNIVMLFYLAEKSVKEISEIMSLSTSNIKVILHRSRKKLQKKIEYDRD
jgi:RNA polymerase sigma-70 factor, ECF subfamily